MVASELIISPSNYIRRLNLMSIGVTRRIWKYCARPPRLGYLTLTQHTRVSNETSAAGWGFAHFAQIDASAIAIIDPQGHAWLRGEVRQLANRIGNAFRAAGLVPGDVLAIAAPNCAEYLVVYLAAVETGLYIVPINWHFTPSEIAFLLQDSGAKAIVTHRLLGSTKLGVLADHAIATVFISIGDAPRFTSLDDFTASASDGPSRDIHTGRTMPYTSATTGKPKGIVLPLESAAVARERFINWNLFLGIEFNNENVHLCSSMLYHSACLDGALVALHMGHSVVLVNEWDPEHALRLIEQRRVTVTYMVPSMFVGLLKLPQSIRSSYSMSSLKCVIHGGAPCPVEVKRQMIEWWGPILWENYGAAEGAGATVSSQEWMRYPGTVGKPIPGSEIRILDEEGAEQRPGQPGLIYMIRYSGERFQYKGDPEKTRACYRGDFFTVGDVGFINEEGYLFICDRKTDMILSGGMNIYSAEIELVLIQHPGVADCAVVGQRDEIFGEVPKAYVQLRRGVEPSSDTSLDIYKYLRTRLTAAKLPKSIEYITKVPRDPSGKLFKRLLRTGPPD